MFSCPRHVAGCLDEEYEDGREREPPRWLVIYMSGARLRPPSSVFDSFHLIVLDVIS